MTKDYLSLKQVAERLGVTPGALTRYALPAPDVRVGTTRGWTAQSIDAWDKSRPGIGNRNPHRHADGEDHTWVALTTGGMRCSVCKATRSTLT